MIRALLIILALLVATPLRAEPVSSQMIEPVGDAIGALGLNASRTFSVNNNTIWRTLIIGVSYDPVAGAAGTAVNMTCGGHWGAETSGKRRELQIVTATSATGVITTENASWTTAVNGAGLVTRKWFWQVTNVPTPIILCTFTGTGTNANDIITVRVGRLTP